jgi:hypothetical protein
VVTIVSNDEGDWEAMYVEGELVAQGHSLQVRDVIYALIREYPKEIEVPQADMEKWGRRFPEALSDIQEA